MSAGSDAFLQSLFGHAVDLTSGVIKEHDAMERNALELKTHNDAHVAFESLDINSPTYDRDLKATRESFRTDDASHNAIATPVIDKIYGSYKAGYESHKKKIKENETSANITQRINRYDTDISQHALDGDTDKYAAGHTELSTFLNEQTKLGHINETSKHKILHDLSLKHALSYVESEKARNPDLTYDSIKGELAKHFDNDTVAQIKLQFSIADQKKLIKQNAEDKVNQKKYNEDVYKNYESKYKHGIDLHELNDPKFINVPKTLKDQVTDLAQNFSLKSNIERKAILQNLADSVNSYDRRDLDFKPTSKEGTPEYEQELSRYNALANEKETKHQTNSQKYKLYERENNYLNANAGIELAEKQGLFGREKIYPIEWNNPASIAYREKKVQIASVHYGKNVDFLTKSEFSNLSKEIAKGDSQTILDITNLASRNDSLKYQLASDPQTANVALLANITRRRTAVLNGDLNDVLIFDEVSPKYTHKIIEPNDTVNNILNGKDVIKVNKDIFGGADFDKELSNIVNFDSVYSDPSSTRYKNLLKENIKNNSAYLLDSGAASNLTDAIKQSIDSVAGGIEYYSNVNSLFVALGVQDSDIEMPVPSMTADSFKGFLNSLSAEDVRLPMAGLTKEETINQIRDGSFVSLGQGQYYLKSKNGKSYARDANNNNIVIDFFDIMQRRKQNDGEKVGVKSFEQYILYGNK